MKDAPRSHRAYTFDSSSAMLTFLLFAGVCQLTLAQDAAIPPAPSEAVRSADSSVPLPLPPADVLPVVHTQPQQATEDVQTSRKVTFDDGWVVEIRPAQARGNGPASSAADLSRYETIYRSIPFRRAEYLANPGYRHDTTVELMFGQMRPTVIHRQDQPQRVVNPRPALYNPGLFTEFEYWRNPGRFIQLIPGFGPVVAPRF